MDPTFASDTTFPPSLQGYPFLTMLTIGAFWIGTLFCLQWIYSLVEDMRECPAPRRHAVTAARMVKILILAAVVLLNAPRLVLVMAWDELTPPIRENVALANWLLFIPWAAVFGIAWWIDRSARPSERPSFAFGKTGFLPAASWGVEKTRVIIIVALIVVVSFATTYIRPANHVPDTYRVERN